jgi:hypothetical protein
MEVRDRCDSDAFLDVSYADLTTNPIEEVRRIFDFLAIEPSDRTLDVMRRWLARNPQHKHGTHHYCLEDFGIDSTQLSKDFTAYRTRFQIPQEPLSP